MAGFPLVGVDAGDPIPGIIREIRFAQGDASSSGKSRDVCLFGNKTSAGSETVDTLGTAIVGLDDCISRFGARSELTLMYRKYVEVDQDATIYGIAVTESGGVASSVVLAVATTATAAGVVRIRVIGEIQEVGVEVGDTPQTVATNIAAKINSQPHWPCTAAATINGAGPAWDVTVTTANIGPRNTHLMNKLRADVIGSLGVTVTKGSVTAGTTADDNTAALAAADAAEIYYHVGPYNITTSATSTDNGMGEHAALITTAALPANGKDQVLICGLVGTQAQATTVAASINNALAALFHAEGSDWTPAMIAAHCAAVKRANEIAHPAANLTDWGLKDGQIFNIPDPYSKADRATKTELRANLNNGVSAIGFTNAGKAYLVRQVTSRHKNGSDYDYRVREGHIPSAIHYFWSQVKAAYASEKQPFIADDPAQGQKPLAGTTYPRAVNSLVAKKMDEMVNFPGGPVLDPSTIQKQKDGIAVLVMTDGVSCRAKPLASRHNLKAGFLIEESGSAY